MNKNTMALIKALIDILILRIEIIGNNSTISTSKIKKITASKKNRKEKGSRADPRGSNPHSNGDDFSRSITVRYDRIHAKAITITGIIQARILEINSTVINIEEILTLIFYDINVARSSGAIFLNR